VQEFIVDGEIVEITDSDLAEAYDIASVAFMDIPLEQRVKLDYANWAKGFVYALVFARDASRKGLL